MTIKLLTKEKYDRLCTLQKEFPVLTFQNNGYEYIDRTKFSDEEKAADEEVQEILKNHVQEFSRFDNFCHNKEGVLRIRIQYHWSLWFTGVGYVKAESLLKGFEDYKETSEGKTSL